ncbi:DUF3040 domain-containing protein [Gordonia zhaorongruii]|uniref:DUF3040 domain-containing protein n=1 Tax=Gordonia zhaorongruii TaxID=2597659 RepID=UPI0010506290|nr:DUF3040 domain-containing protein [Gordonia zhaorongruii]
MPLSEHEQRMLDEIESALYAEDPKFASSVTKKRVVRPTARRRLIAVLGVLIGLGMLVGGLMVDVEIGGLKILSFAGFLVMFGAAAFGLLAGGHDNGDKGAASERGVKSGGKTHTPRGDGKSSKSSLSSRMEERFHRRFDQDGL